MNPTYMDVPPPGNTIDGEVEKILVEMSVDIIDPLTSDLEPTQEAIKKIKKLIAQEAKQAMLRQRAFDQKLIDKEANKARLDELRIMWDWPKNKGLAYFEQRIQKREAELIRLTADKEQVLQNKTNDGGRNGDSD